MKAMKKLAAIFIIIFLLAPTTLVFGEEALFETDPGRQILFVIDCSNSMNSNDANKYVPEIIKMFIDCVQGSKTDIGFITYNDTILSTQTFLPMSNAGNNENIKRKLDEISYTGSTDIGLALNYGMDMLSENKKEGCSPVMILFSDGDTDLTYSRTGRTLEDSANDESAAYEKSAELGCPVYTVGITSGGKLNTEFLQTIADKTGGKKYEIHEDRDLFELFDTIYQETVNASFAHIETVNAEGPDRQNARFDIPGRFIDEVNIILQHDKPLNDVGADAETAVSVYSSKTFTSVKITRPLGKALNDALNIGFTPTGDSEVKISVIYYVTVLPKIERPGNSSTGYILIPLNLYDTADNTKITDAAFYSGLEARLTVTDINSGEPKEYTMLFDSGGFQAIINADETSTFSLSASVTGANYYKTARTVNIDVGGHPPTQEKQDAIRVLKQDKPVELDMDGFFSSNSGGTLSYKVINYNKDLYTAEFSASTLMLTPISAGDDEMSVLVSDSNGGEIMGQLQIKILPFWMFYRNEIVIIGCVFIVLLFLSLMYIYNRTDPRRRRYQEPTLPADPEYTPGDDEMNPITGFRSRVGFNGARFEGYFLNTLSGSDIPVLYWQASYIESRHSIRLSELLAMLDVPEHLPEANKIYFEAGNNNRLIFMHNTNCIVTLGGKDVKAGKKEVLSFDDRLYIVFEDTVTELEFRYKRAKNTARV